MSAHLVRMAKKRRRKAAPAKGTRKRPAAGGKRKRRKRKMKLTLRSRGIKKKDEYRDSLGWTTTGTSQAAAEAEVDDLPEVVTHQCSMCGAMNKIPRPKRDRYKVICAQEECGNEDNVGFDE